MSDVRLILNSLSDQSLARLLRERGLPPAKGLNAKRNALSRSYRGAIGDLASSLQRQELIEFYEGFVLKRDDVYYEIKRPSALSKDQLQSLTTRFYEDARGVPREFEVYASEAPDPKKIEEEEPSDGDEEVLTEDQSAEAEQTEEKVDEYAASFGPSWSRPTFLHRLVSHFLRVDVARLQTGRFQSLLQRLDELGLEMQLPDQTIANSESESPGINTKVRLRSKSAQDKVAPSSRPIEFVLGGTGPARDILSKQGYPLALLRLQFLTAIPDHVRPSQANWPQEFLECAVRGLELPPAELRLLTLTSASFGMGAQSALQVAQQLRRYLRASEWAPLFADFVRLNSSLGPMAEEVVAVVRSHLALPTSDPANQPQPHGQPQRVHTDETEEKQAASSDTAKNKRDLGALEDMFGPPRNS